MDDFLEPGTMAMITWGDAWEAAGWTDPESVDHSPVEVKTLGIVLAHDDDGVSMANSINALGGVAGPFFIPAGMVWKCEVLAVRRQRVRGV